jgi:hypothetical protein
MLQASPTSEIEKHGNVVSKTPPHSSLHYQNFKKYQQGG